MPVFKIGAINRSALIQKGYLASFFRIV